MNNPFEILANLQDRIPPEKLKAYDIDWFLILRIIGGDLESIVELSNRLIEDMDINKRLPVGQKTGVVTPSDAKALSNAMFKGCSIFGSPPPAPLVKLNEILLGAEVKPRAASKEPAKKRMAFLIFLENPKVSVRALAQDLDIAVGTASTWLNEFRALESRVRSRYGDQ